MLTEDIDISWKLQINHWDVRFEPHALSWILMPETLAGLWKQRLRWAMGGSQAILKYAFIFTKWNNRRMWPVFLEYVASVFWAYAMGLVVVLWLIGLFVHMPLRWQITAVPHWHGALIGTTCLMQVMLAMWLDRSYDKRMFRHFFWMVWYPLAYWTLNMCTTIWAVPKVFFRSKGRRAVWVSPDRGVRKSAPHKHEAEADTLHEAACTPVPTRLATRTNVAVIGE